MQVFAGRQYFFKNLNFIVRSTQIYACTYALILSFQVFITPAIYATLQVWNNSPTTSQEICAIVYGGALIALFLVSTIFHVILMIDKTRFACLSCNFVKIRFLLNCWFLIFCKNSSVPWIRLVVWITIYNNWLEPCNIIFSDLIGYLQARNRFGWGY